MSRYFFFDWAPPPFSRRQGDQRIIPKMVVPNSVYSNFLWGGNSWITGMAYVCRDDGLMIFILDVNGHRPSDHIICTDVAPQLATSLKREGYGHVDVFHKQNNIAKFDFTHDPVRINPPDSSWETEGLDAVWAKVSEVLKNSATITKLASLRRTGEVTDRPVLVSLQALHARAWSYYVSQLAPEWTKVRKHCFWFAGSWAALTVSVVLFALSFSAPPKFQVSHIVTSVLAGVLAYGLALWILYLKRIVSLRRKIALTGIGYLTICDLFKSYILSQDTDLNSIPPLPFERHIKVLEIFALQEQDRFAYLSQTWLYTAGAIAAVAAILALK